jgi:hypothetical protein
MSIGARMLYVVLKGQSSNANNLAYLSYRDAATELGINKKHLRNIAEWFRELEHYGFIVLHRYGSLGVEGDGKAPQWRLTEKGVAATAERPTCDYLRWDGVLFEPKRRPNRLTTLPAGAKKPHKGDTMVKLDMSPTRPTPHDDDMSPTRPTVGNGTVGNAVYTTVDNAAYRVLATRPTGFCFSAEGNEHELAERFLAALSVRDRSPKD